MTPRIVAPMLLMIPILAAPAGCANEKKSIHERRPRVSIRTKAEPDLKDGNDRRVARTPADGPIDARD